MAQYKVPQDVEADDKLIGPFSFRQFIYLLIVAAAIAIAWALFPISPLLSLIPLPLILFFGILALPLKKDQPMETYLAAVVSYYLKPRKRVWKPGQKESSIEITAPKIKEVSRTRNITGEEASHRLSFLANVVDSEGRSVIEQNSSLREEYIAEASSTYDILDTSATYNLDRMIDSEKQNRKDALIAQMREAINRTSQLEQTPTITKFNLNYLAQTNQKSTLKPQSNTPPSPNNPSPSVSKNQNTTPKPNPTPKEPIKPQNNPSKTTQSEEIFISLH